MMQHDARVAERADLGGSHFEHTWVKGLKKTVHITKVLYHTKH